MTKLEQQRIASVHGNAARFTNAALAGLAYKADFSKVCGVCLLVVVIYDSDCAFYCSILISMTFYALVY